MDLINKARNLAEHNPNPFLLLDKKKIRENYFEIKHSMDNLEIYYSIKANPSIEVLRTLVDLASGFDAASWNEIEILISDLAVHPSVITFSAPTKIPSHIDRAYNVGVKMFAYDNKSEVEKLAKLAPNSEVFLRIIVDNEGSDWPLVGKFGVDYREALDLLLYAKKYKLKPIGLTFHVGSQCRCPKTWEKAIERCSIVWQEAIKVGINLKTINLGGGIPVEYKKEIPKVNEIGNSIEYALKKYLPEDIKIMIEPGRSMTGNAAILAASVIGFTHRNGENWLYLDTGVYNGLFEAFEGFEYNIIVDKKKYNNQEYILAGPTCDSTDVIMKEVSLPKLKVGDRVYFMNTGAYTTAYEKYNGFNFPKTYLI